MRQLLMTRYRALKSVPIVKNGPRKKGREPDHISLAIGLAVALVAGLFAKGFI